uniref:autotransporter family protein n=1 Tax=Castellaniella defragrans TaxID=75697 RepID=UPI00333F7E3F
MQLFIALDMQRIAMPEAVSRSARVRSLSCSIFFATLALVTFDTQPSYAQQVVANGTIKAASGEIDTGTAAQTAGYGLHALNNGSITGSPGLTVTTGGTDAYGAAVFDTSRITLADGSSVTTTGNGGHGLYLRGVGGFLSASDTAITTSGLGAYGANVQYGQMQLTNVHILTTGGNASFGVAINYAGTRLTIDGGSVTTNGNASDALLADNGSTLTATGVKVETTGDYAYGVSAENGATVTLTGGSVTTTGDFGVGLFGMSQPGIENTSLIADAVAVTTSGQKSHGVVLQSGSILNVKNGSSILTEGVDSAALFAQTGYGANNNTSTVTVAESSLTSQQYVGALVSGTTLNATLTGSSLSGTAAWWVYNNGTLNLMADASTLIGAGLKNDVSVSNIALLNNTLWTMTGNSDVSTLINDASTITFTAPTGDPAQPASYKTLTTGSYVGNGGKIGLNTSLGNDGSPSDRLVINGGTASGASALIITNTGGAGAQTTSNGILVVDTTNGGTTSAAAFTLGARAAAGAYGYLLFRGGIGADAGNQNWYLRSQLDCTLPGAAGMTECHGGGGGEVPIYRPEVIVDTVIPALASRFGLGMLGTWHERTGGEFATSYVTADGRRRASWGRIFGDTGRYGMGFGGGVGNRSNAFGSHGSSYDFTFGGLQAGMDLIRREHNDGSRDLAGFYVGAGSARADVRSVIDFGFGSNAGRVSMDGYSLGGYYTHIGPGGWYADTVLQGTYYADISAASNINEAQTLRTSGEGVLASLEGGYPIALGSDLTFEPQAQIVYQHLDFGDDADKFGRIAFSDSDAWYGRLSGRLARDWTLEDGRKVMGWARAGVWTDFGAQATTTFSSPEGLNPTAFGTDLGGTWAQFDLGVSAQLSDTVSVFVLGNYNVSLTSADGHSFGGRAGVKVAW